MTRHAFDIFSFGTGLMFTLLALGYLLVPATMSAVVVIPLMLIGLGIFGIAALLVAQRRSTSQ